MPERSWIVRRIMPTVAVTSAHTKIFPMCCRASASPSEIVASSPCRRFMAVPITAALKKIVTNASATYITKPKT